jgi:hypothetical protein
VTGWLSRIAIYTEELNLTADEAKVFWPLFNEYSQKQKELKMQSNELKMKYGNMNNISNNEAIEAINKFLELEQKELDLKKEYMNKIARVIPPQKALRINKAEQRFKKALLEQIKDMRDE